MATVAIPIKVIQRRLWVKIPPLKSFIIFSFPEIKAIKATRGTAAIPFRTAV